MLRWLKKAGSIFVPTALAFGRVASSAGQPLFTISKFVQYITQTATAYAHPAALPSALAAMFFNILMNVGARVPKMYQRFFPAQQKAIAATSIDIEDDYDIEEQPEGKTKQQQINFQDLNCTGKILYLQFVSVGGILSGILGAYSSLLSADSYVSAYKNYKGDDSPNTTEQEYYVLLLGTYFFTCSMYAFLMNNFSSINQNSKKFAFAISTRQIPCNKYVFWTGTIASFSIICTPFLAKFSMEANVEKTQTLLNNFFQLNIPEKFKTGMGYVSAIAATEQQLMANIPSVYNSLSRTESTRYENERCWEGPLKKTFYVMGIGDGIATSLSNYTGYAHQLDAHNINSHHPGAIVFGSLAALSTGTLVYFFTAVEGVQGSLDYFHARRGEYPFKNLPQDEILFDAKQTSEKIYTTKKSFCCFFSKSNRNDEDNASNSIDMTRVLSFKEFDEILEEQTRPTSGCSKLCL